MIRSEISLKNTLALTSSADHVAAVDSVADAQDAIEFGRRNDAELRCLGEGSNVVLMPRVSGLICRVTQANITLVNTDAESVTVSVGAGKNWHELVQETLAQNWYGLENLALIPGTVGAAPIQNIGAYGIELSELFHSLEAVHLPTGELHTMQADDCRFGYRDSLFKQAGRNQYVITAITLSLSTRPHLRLSYPALLQALEGCDAASLTPAMVSAAVCEVRRSKLPDPASLPNTGSFFKNPVVTEDQAAALRQQFPDIVCYPQTDGTVKLAAGWLVEQAGWRGVTRGRVGVHDRQSLVLVNFGGGTGAEVLALAEEISDSVQQKFAVALEIEPTIYPAPVKKPL